MHARSEIYQTRAFAACALDFLGSGTMGVERVGEEMEIMEDVAVDLHREIAGMVKRKGESVAAHRRRDIVRERADAAGGHSTAVVDHAHINRSVEIEIGHRGCLNAMTGVAYLIHFHRIDVYMLPRTAVLTHFYGEVI